jgi:predicted ArsR family transcriptional regulator
VHFTGPQSPALALSRDAAVLAAVVTPASGVAAPDVPSAPAPSRVAESRTRDRVARTVLEHGPVTAADVACRLGVTAAAVRRHLDALEAEGLVQAREARSSAPRGRGRPARAYVLTDAGHASMTTGYDDLAASAMAFLAEQLGERAVEAFAARRVGELEQRYAPAVERAGDDVDARTEALAQALADDGYAASARPVRGPAGDVGTQLCQGHCPVQHVAARFPQLCDAETEVFSRLLGVHVQRLATLARGAHVCTTHVPARATTATPTAQTSTTQTSTTETSTTETSTTETSTTETSTTGTTSSTPRTPDGRNAR